MVSAEEVLNSKISELMGFDADYVHNSGSAISVLQTLHKKGWFWRLDSVHDGVICTLQGIPVDAKSLQDRKTFSIRSATLAQAICEAAVKTLDENVTSQKV